MLMISSMEPDNQFPNQQPPSPYQQPQFSPNPYAQQNIPVGLSNNSRSRAPSFAVIISFVVMLLFLVGAIIFAAWAYTGRQDYKNNVDEKVAAGVEVAREELVAQKDIEVAEAAKEPYKEYQGPSAYGSIKILYPKTWSALVSLDDRSTPVNGFFHPDYLPGLESGTAFALRVRVVEKSYETTLSSYDNLVKRGSVQTSPYSLPKMPSITGSVIEGAISRDVSNGTIVLLPMRDKTLEISTLSTDYLNDFKNIILENFTFEP